MILEKIEIFWALGHEVLKWIQSGQKMLILEGPAEMERNEFEEKQCPFINFHAEPNPDCLVFTTKGLFVTPITLTSNYNFLIFLECFYMVLINKKQV